MDTNNTLENQEIELSMPKMPRILVKDMILKWWNEYKYSLLDSSRARKESILKLHILPDLGNYYADEITLDILDNYVKAKIRFGNKRSKSGGLSPKSVKSHFNVLRPAFDWGVGHGYLRMNYTRKIKLPQGKKEIHPLSTIEVIKLIFYAGTFFLAVIIIIAWRTGMRREEVFGLKKQDINFFHRFVSIQRAVTAYSPNNIQIGNTKTPSSRRRIQLDFITLLVLWVLCRRSKSDFLITDSNGILINPFVVTELFYAACKRAGIPRHRYHDLRHTHATVLMARGISPKIIQERLGHASSRETNDTYSHVSPSIQRQAVRHIWSLLDLTLIVLLPFIFIFNHKPKISTKLFSKMPRKELMNALK